MKKRIHILTADEHRRLMVEPYERWRIEQRDPKYRNKYHRGFPYDEASGLAAPKERKYVWPVFDWAGEQFVGEEVAYFIDKAAAEEWCDRKNALCPPPPKPSMPEPLYPVGTYFAVELADHRWEVWRVREPRHDRWSEKLVSVHPTKEEARQDLIRLVTKK